MAKVKKDFFDQTIISAGEEQAQKETTRDLPLIPIGSHTMTLVKSEFKTSGNGNPMIVNTLKLDDNHKLLNDYQVFSPDMNDKKKRKFVSFWAKGFNVQLTPVDSKDLAEICEAFHKQILAHEVLGRPVEVYVRHAEELWKRKDEVSGKEKISLVMKMSLFTVGKAGVKLSTSFPGIWELSDKDKLIYAKYKQENEQASEPSSTATNPAVPSYLQINNVDDSDIPF